MTTMLSAPQSAQAIGLCCWLEQQVFALLGSWITEVGESGPKLTMLELSDHAAWRAQRWYELLPTAPPGADALVMGTEALEALVLSAHSVDGNANTIEKFVVAETLLGLLSQLVAELLGRTTAIAGAAVRRIADIAATDLDIDLASCRLVLSASVPAPNGDFLAGFDQLRTPFETVSALEFLD
jgi:hypothetical protein